MPLLLAEEIWRAQALLGWGCSQSEKERQAWEASASIKTAAEGLRQS